MRQPAKGRRNGALLQFHGALIELVDPGARGPGLGAHRPLPGVDIFRDARQ